MVNEASNSENLNLRLRIQEIKDKIQERERE
jgi:hypothetical protein